nr:MAG TPA: hypothetical protein [Caudoviricetes sp.]
MFKFCILLIIVILSLFYRNLFAIFCDKEYVCIIKEQIKTSKDN